MSIVNALDILVPATVGKYAVGAFNITNIIQMESVVEAHIEANAPLIIQTSVTPAKFLGLSVLTSVYRAIAQEAPIPICLHLDHSREVEFCKECAQAGWTNIMIDASRQPFEENIRQTKEVVDFAHSIGDITVEGELGTVSGVEDQIRIAEDETQLCDPEQAAQFVAETGVDLLAPAIGTAHGVYKTKDPKVDFDRFDRIFKMLNSSGTRVPLVVHGGTGLPENYVKKLIELGGSKFNVSTDLKLTLIDAQFEYISSNRDEYNPGKLDAFVKEATKTKVKQWISMLGCTGKA